MNWAIFEPFMVLVDNPGGEWIFAADPDLQQALKIHGLRLS